MREGIGSFDVQQIYVIDDPVKLLSRNSRKINVYTSSNARDHQRCAIEQSKRRPYRKQTAKQTSF